MTRDKPVMLYFLSGESISIDREGVMTLLSCPIGMFIIMFSGSITRTYNVLVLDVPIGIAETLVLSSGLAFILWVMLLGLGFSLVWIGNLFRRCINVPVPLIGSISILLNDLPILWAISWVFGLETWNLTAAFGVYLLNYTIHLGFELLFVAVVVPKAKRRIMHNVSDSLAVCRGDTEAASNFSYLLVAGNKVLVDNIKLIEADEHYVYVHFANRKIHARERFGSLVKALDKAAGMQVHKSYWVAFDHVLSVQTRQDGGLKLVLKDNIIIPGARNRARAIRTAFQNYERYCV